MSWLSPVFPKKNGSFATLLVRSSIRFIWRGITEGLVRLDQLHRVCSIYDVMMTDVRMLSDDEVKCDDSTIIRSVLTRLFFDGTRGTLGGGS